MSAPGAGCKRAGSSPSARCSRIIRVVDSDRARQQSTADSAAGNQLGPRPAETPDCDLRKSVGRSQSNKELSLALLADAWARIKTIFAIVAPISGTAGLISAISMLAGTNYGYSTLRLALITASCVVVLLVWVLKFAIPLVTRGRVPNGQLLTDVIARERLRRRRARNRRARRRRAGL